MIEKTRALFFAAGGETRLCLNVYESTDAPPASHLWPSALVLARWLWHVRNSDNVFSGVSFTHVVELGCGTALPGLLAAAIAVRYGKRDRVRVVLTDIDKHALKLAALSAHENGIEDICRVSQLTWGPTVPSSIFEHEHNGCGDCNLLIIAADTLYDRSAFDVFLATVAGLLHEHRTRTRGLKDGKCVMAYQERSSRRCVQHLICKWGLVAETIEGSSFGFVSGRIGRLSEENAEGLALEAVTKNSPGSDGSDEDSCTDTDTDADADADARLTGLHSVFVCVLRLRE
ncbi:hypothetical protein HDU82_002002 [Entophlyctis luteolus]|nr:hypothetical protein HDU82_002002 [Entophlyctis luteolus]